MVLALLTFFTGIAISTIAIYYSVLGLASIFSAAAVSVIIMGTVLEISKLVTAWWLKANWHRTPWSLKGYLTIAVITLMFITSMGIFGFLSKAHSDQNLVGGDVQAKISLIDEKIKISKDNIEGNRKQLKQLDEAVDQVMARSTSEQGADRSNQIRRSQAKDRERLLKEIEVEQKKITALNEEAAPIRAEIRQVEAEVGPIKYIAAIIYGDNLDSNLLEKAVVWVIIIIVFVFDPLAILLLLASQYSFIWAGNTSSNQPSFWTRIKNEMRPKQPDEKKYEPDDGPLTEDQINQIKESVKENFSLKETLVNTSSIEPIIDKVAENIPDVKPDQATITTTNESSTNFGPIVQNDTVLIPLATEVQVKEQEENLNEKEITADSSIVKLGEPIQSKVIKLEENDIESQKKK